MGQRKKRYQETNIPHFRKYYRTWPYTQHMTVNKENKESKEHRCGEDFWHGKLHVPKANSFSSSAMLPPANIWSVRPASGYIVLRI